MKTPEDFKRFIAWANDHLGQGYSLEIEDNTFVDKVTRWAFNAYTAAYNAQQAKIMSLQATVDQLMLELQAQGLPPQSGFCPNEMSKEQMDEWEKHQKRAPEEFQK